MLEVHDPPGVTSLNVVLPPTHNDVVPVIGAGLGFIVKFFVMKQPVDVKV